MRLFRKSVLLALILIAGSAPSASAQARWVAVDSNQPDAIVYADSVWLGTAIQGLFLLPDRVRSISVVPPSVDTWSVRSIAYRITGMEGDTVSVVANFPYHYRLESVPSGAAVILNENGERTQLGTTPLDYESEQPIAGELSFDLSGHMVRSVTPEQNLWSRHLVLLEPMVQSNTRRSDISVSTKSSHRWIDYAAIGVAVTGGILAVHYKTKADNRYDAYNETRNPDLKSEIRQLDVYSGVALGTMQVGLGVLAFRLVF